MQFLKRKKLTPSEQRTEDYMKLGKQVAALYDHLNPDRHGLYRTAFLKGLVTGVGSVVGATIVIALVVWFLALVGHVPFLEPLTDEALKTLESR